MNVCTKNLRRMGEYETKGNKATTKYKTIPTLQLIQRR